MFVNGSGQIVQSLIVYGGHSIDAAYQVSFHFAKRRRILEIDQPETRIACMAAMFVNRSGQNEQSL